MVYKKYVYKRGKKHGPYYYHSYREGNSVRKVYIGGKKEYNAWLKKRDRKKKKGVEQRSAKYGLLFTIALICLILAITVHFNTFLKFENVTGYVVSEDIPVTEEIEYSLYGEFEEEIIVESFDTEIIDLEIIEPAKFAGEAITENKNKRMNFKFRGGDLLLYFDLINYKEFVKEVERSAEEKVKKEKEDKLYKGAEPEEIAEAAAEAEAEAAEAAAEAGQEAAEAEAEAAEEETEAEEEEEEEIEPGITGGVVKENGRNKEVQEKIKGLDKKELEIISDNSIMDLEGFEIEVEKPEYKNPKYKWGYRVKLKDLNFMARVEVTSDRGLEILKDNTIKIDNYLLSFKDLVAQGYDVRIESPALDMDVEKLNWQNSEEVPEDEKEKREKEKAPRGITGRFIDMFATRRAVEDLKYRNVLVVYIERDFTGTQYNIGDIVYLDPTLIIEISKAEHLDEGREFISDIYSQASALDGNWSEPIDNNEYVRVTFEQALDNTKDITIYARSVGGSSEIEVYTKDSDEIITRFENISTEGWYKVYLTELQGVHDVFDLKVLGGVEFDYIVDPQANDTSTVYRCGTLDSPGEYVMNQSIINNTLSGDCITISTGNVTLDCAGYSISSINNVTGVNTNSQNTTIKNCDISMGRGSEGIGIEFGDGLFGYAENSYVYNCTLNNQGYGIYNDNGFDPALSLKIEKVTASGNAFHGIHFFGAGLSGSYNLTDIIANNNTQDGIFIESASDNFLINITANSNGDDGVDCANSGNTLANITASWNADDGVIVTDSNSIIDVTADWNGDGVLVGDMCIVKDIIARNNSAYGFYGDTGNNITDVIASNSSQNGLGLAGPNNNLTHSQIDLNGQIGLVLTSASSENSIMNITLTGNDYGIYLYSSSSNNNLTNIRISSSGIADVYLHTSCVNNIFLNASYDSSLETVNAGCGLIRKWHYRAHVNDTSGNNVNNANVTAYNASSSYMFNLTTNTEGYTQIGEITDYINTAGSRTYYSPYNIYASNASYVTSNHTYNTTSNESNYKDEFILSSPDSAAPNVTVVAPTNGTTYVQSTMEFNLTVVDDTEVSSCSYTLNSGINNYTMTNTTSSAFNATNTSIADGTYTARFYCNDTAGNLNNTEQVTFTLETGLNVTICRNLTQAGATYVQQADLSSDITCIGIKAQNIVYDCNGYRINSIGGMFGFGVTTNQANTTIKNCNITMGDFSGTGIQLLSGSSGSYVYNCTLNDQDRGLHIYSNSNRIEKIIANSNSEGIYLTGSNNNFTRITINDNSYGITGSASYSIFRYITANSNGYMVYLSNSDNNNFTDSDLSGSLINDIYMEESSTGNIFLNVTYPLAGENVVSGSLTRKWHYSAYVNDTSGTGVFAEIYIYNASRELVETLSTNATGGMAPVGLIDYTSNGTRTYYGVRSIWAKNSTLGVGYFENYNITALQNRIGFVTTLDNIHSCISPPFSNTVYIQSADITDNSLEDVCINITTENVTLDCQGYSISSDDNVAGIYSEKFNTTIKNCDISMNYTGGYGVRLAYSNNSYILNNTLNSQQYGLFSSGDYIRVENNTVNSNQLAVYIGSGSHNNLTNNNIWNCTSNTSCLSLDLTNNNSITRGRINLSSKDLIYLVGSSYNNFSDLELIGATQQDIDVRRVVNSTAECVEHTAGLVCSDILTAGACNNQSHSGIDECVWSGSCLDYNITADPECGYFNNQADCEGNNQDDHCEWRPTTYIDSTNNTFLNVSYNISKEDVETSCSLTREWYYRGNVSEYYSEDSVPNTNLSVYDNTNTNKFNLTANATSHTSTKRIIDYVNSGGTKTYYSPYNIYPLDSPYFGVHKSNITSLQNDLDEIHLIKSQTNITLNEGWNLITLLFEENDSATDRNISISENWNLIGYSSNVNVSVDNLTFTNSSGSLSSWEDAVTNNQVQAYLSYYDSSSANASERKYKYTSLTSLAMDSSVLTRDHGYWLYANQAGTLTLPGIGGSYSNETYLWSKLRFRNGSNVEKGIINAYIADWINFDFNYWNTTLNRFESIMQGADRTSINPSEGVFIYSYEDNVTLIRQN